MKVLFANELGGGLGHLVPLKAVATALGPAWECCFALPDPDMARKSVLDGVDRPTSLVRVPAWRPPSAKTKEPLPPNHAFADALHTMGLGDAGVWRRVMRFWSDLLDATRPDLVVTDAAPGIRLAAAGCVPVVAIGNGYSTPPPGRLLPSLVTATPDVPPSTRRREALVLAAANEVQGERGGPTLDHVADLFNGDATFVGSHPALDPYRAYRTGSTWWPCAVPFPKASPRRDASSVFLFVYLHAQHPALEAVLDLVGEIGRGRGAFGAAAHTKPVLHVYVLGEDPGRVAERCGPGVVVHDRPIEPADLLVRTHLLVHQGGIRMCHEALACGTAQMLLPLHLEHALASRALQGLGVGLALSPPVRGEDYRAALQDGLEHLLRPEVQAEAAGRADELRAADFGDTLGTIVATCRRLAGLTSEVVQ